VYDVHLVSKKEHNLSNPNDFTFSFTSTEKGIRPISYDSGATNIPEKERDVPKSVESPFVNRRSMLEEADSLVNGDRNVDYGDPIDDFRRTAGMWGHYLGMALDPHDVAAMMAMLKLSRIRWSPGKRDNWVDLAGYAACGYDCSVRENAE
jgi:hypothetical protein